MQDDRAQRILQALVQGVDPLTGAELTASGVLQQAEVLRALLAGAAALGHMAARAQRRAQLPDNVGRPWAEEEDARLLTAFRAGDSVLEIAARHRRTQRAIEARLEKNGLIEPRAQARAGALGEPGESA